MLTEEAVEDHVRTKHRRLWSTMERQRDREDRNAQGKASYDLLEKLAGLLAGTGGGAKPEDLFGPDMAEDAQEEVEVVTPVAAVRRRHEAVACKDCGKVVKSLGLHKPYCKGAN